MSRHRILELGAGPADEPCAQLGQCADFAAANTLELLAYKAAIIALNGEPPLPLGFALVANAHDFGIYRTLWLVSSEQTLPEDGQAWLDDLVEPATWIAAGFPQPVTYDGSRAVMRPFREVITAALQITRANADGSFFPAQNAVLHRNLLAAYGPATVAAADTGYSVHVTEQPDLAVWTIVGLNRIEITQHEGEVAARLEALRAVGDTPRRLDLLPTKPLPRSDD